MSFTLSGRESYKNKRDIRGHLTASDMKHIHEMKVTLRKHKVRTVCENAKCPNITECFLKPAATFIILGKACTRSCAFCAVESSSPQPVDENEPENVARAVKHLKLKHVVITSVTRDDLTDKGITQFIRTVDEVKKAAPETTIELLTPDFKGLSDSLLGDLLSEGPLTLGHNVEMVKRLYPEIRKQSDYDLSLDLMRRVKRLNDSITTKSAIMLGLGETRDEVRELINDIRDTDCDALVIGQYLQPTLKHTPVVDYIAPEEFKFYEEYSYSLGFEKVVSFAKARSSYAV